MTVYYVDVLNGSDAASGLSELLAWETLEKAANTVAAGDKVWVENTGTYEAEDGSSSAVMAIDTVGGYSTPVVFEAYDATPGDGGIVEIDGTTNTLDYCITATVSGTSCYVFKGFVFTGATGSGVNITNLSYNFFENCSFENNGGAGFVGNVGNKFLNCRFYANGNAGINHGSYGMAVISSVFHGNGSYAIYCLAGWAIHTLFYNNGPGGLGATCWWDFSVWPDGLVNCTIDGENKASHIGLYAPSVSGAAGVSLVNTIIYDCGTGANCSVSVPDFHAVRNNLYASVVTPRTNFPTGVGDVVDAADPFTASGGRDYTLHNTSAAKEAGVDAGYCAAFWDSYDAADNPPDPAGEPKVSYIDIGAVQREEPTGGGISRRPRAKEHGV